MLEIVLAWIYITAVCWGWGFLTTRLLSYITGQDNMRLPSASIVCMTGLASLAIIAGYLSLFIALGSWQVQILIIFPLLVTVAYKRKQVASLFAYLVGQTLKLHALVKTMLILFIVLILLMSSWVIEHPDTLGYHIQTIKWIEQFKAIPGLIHLHIRYGYQGLWYCLCALFGFSFTGTKGVTFLNSTVTLWFLIFVLKQINEGLIAIKRNEKPVLSDVMLYILLLCSSSWSYVQLRLTATSESADFIAALYVWLVIYLVCKKEEDKKSAYTLASFLSVVAVTIKLSTIPVVLLFIYCLYRLTKWKRMKAVFMLLIIALVSVIPFVSRNIISSGYLVFPSPLPSIVHVDWKISQGSNDLERKYIRGYARVGEINGSEEIEAASSMKWSQWIPIWWQRLSIPDKVMLASLALLLVAGIFRFRTLMSSDETFLIIWVISIAAIAFWFSQAPDPRFGLAFLIPIQGIILKSLLDKWPSFPYKKNITIYGIAAFIVLLFSYSTYRLTYYFNRDQIIHPAGALHVEYRKVTCHDIIMFTPAYDQPCSNTPLPCFYDHCDMFENRGKSITDGFRPANRSEMSNDRY
jgi:hypothetical protein